MPVPRRASASTRALPWVFAGVGVTTVFALHRDFGATWDEGVQATYGSLVLDAMLDPGRIDEAVAFLDLRFYGPLLEVGLAAVTRAIGGPVFETRHLVLGCLSLLAFPAISRFAGLFGLRRVATFSVVALLCQPRWVGHAFANSKDVPFAVAVVWLLALWSEALLVSGFSRPRLAATAAAFGLALALRPGALPILLVLLAASAAAARAGRPEAPPLPGWRGLATAFAFSWVLMIAAWPWAWQSPILHPLEAMKEAGSFSVAYPVLFDGEEISSVDLPRHYLPWFLFATAPPGVLALAGLGVGAAITRARRDPAGPASRAAAVLAAWTFLPVAAVVVLRPNIYDGIRHFLFLLPALALWAGLGSAHALAVARDGHRIRRHATAGIVALLLASSVPSLVRLHPYQATYFAPTVGGLPGVANRVETDYWGASTQEAIRWLNDVAAREPGRPMVVLLAAGDYLIDAAREAAAPEVLVLSRGDMRSTNLPGSAVDFYVWPTRSAWNTPAPGAPVVHRVGRDGVPFTIVQQLAPWPDEAASEDGGAIPPGGDLPAALPETAAVRPDP